MSSSGSRAAPVRLGSSGPIRCAWSGVDDDSVHQAARNLHQPGVQRPPLLNALHLRDHPTAAALRRQRHRGDAQADRLVLEAEVAVLVGRGPADDGHVYGEGRIEEVLLIL